MELALQPVLAQLYTNAELRSRFFANPQLVGAELGLNTTQIQQLSLLSAAEVNLFATSLKRKRLEEVRELLPMSAKALDKDFYKLFWQYAETYIPQGIKKHLQDAIAFANYIEKLDNIEPEWILDLVKYEKSWLEAAEPNRRLILRCFRYAVNRSDGNFQVLQQPSLAIWFRLLSRVNYEKSWLEAAEPNRRLILRCFRYAVNRSDGNFQVLQQPSLAIWFRLLSRGKLRYRAVGRSHLF